MATETRLERLHRLRKEREDAQAALDEATEGMKVVASEMHKEGVPLARLAREAGVSVQSIRVWVGVDPSFGEQHTRTRHGKKIKGPRLGE